MDDVAQRQWVDPPPVQPSQELIDVVDGSRLAAELLVRHGITDPTDARAFLFPDQYQPSPPAGFPGMDAAAERILKAVRDGEEVCVWGDFDVDGQTSTTILVSALRHLKACVRHYIPLRETESHGVHLASLMKLAAEGVKLLVTCDTGISAVAETAWAKSHGMDVVITDHHELPEILPAADAIVNPRLLPPDHPLYPLPGCGVAYKLAEELLNRSGMGDYAETLLDLAALGIVADVAELRGEARYLLQRGLVTLRETRRVGLQQLYNIAGVDTASFSEETIGFALTPRLNALGRLGNANPIVDFFTTTSNSEAVIFANQLEALNNQRRLACDQVYRGAISQIEANPALLNTSALVLASPGWPAGVIGIVASRLVERFHRPVILFNAPEEGNARGSARSIPGINITTAITELREMLLGFGGHPMAAGMSLPPNRIPDFRQALSYAIDRQNEGLEPEYLLKLDAILPLDQVSLPTVQELELLAPFGNGNPSPVFMSANHRVVEVLPIGTSQEHQIITIEDANGSIFKILRWYGADLPLPESTFDLAYTPRASTYQGKKQLQFEWVDSRPVHSASVKFPARAKLEVEDLRSADRTTSLARLSGQQDTVFWAEGFHLEGVDLLDRTRLHPAGTLVIAFTPPGADEIKAAVTRVKPQKVILLPANPAGDDPHLLQNLVSLIKQQVSTGVGKLTLETLAGNMGQRAKVIQLALEVLRTAGSLDYTEQADNSLTFTRWDGTSHGDVASAEKKLRTSLAETAAFRRHFASAPVADLLRDYFLP
jgi:single-stranded-DNA-specific exonuclease